MSARGPSPCADGHPAGAYVWTLTDARGIPCGRVCDRCEDHRRAGYRPEIFETASYAADEPIEPEDF